jgi:hypothetical protein
LTSLVCARACGGAQLRDGTCDYTGACACACRRLGHGGRPERRRTARQPKGPTIETEQRRARAVGTAAAPARRFPAWHEGRLTQWRRGCGRYHSPPRCKGRASTDEWGNGSSPRWPRAKVQTMVKKREAGWPAWKKKTARRTEEAEEVVASRYLASRHP